MRSTAELRKKLIAEGYDPGDVEAALIRLKEIHLVDDGTLARSVARHYKDRGNRFIAQKLRAKGIAADEDELALEELPDELARAMVTGEKKLRSLTKFEPQIQKQKLYQYLASRGFSGSVVQKSVRRLVTKGEDFEIDQD